MSSKPRDISMVLRGFGKGPLITKEMALAIAQLVLTQEFGRDDFERQRPLTIRDEGASWVIEGSREYDYEAPRDNQMVEGKAHVEIAKENGAILALMKHVDVADPKPAPQ